MNKPLLLTTGALLFGALNVATPNEAAADIRVSVGGGVHVGTHVRPAYRPVYRPYYRPRYTVGGTIWVGRPYPSYAYRTYAVPPPAPTCDCGPGAVPSYYPGYYGAAPSATAVVSAGPEPLPRFGLGGFVGGVEVDGEGGSDIGLLLRLRLTEGWLLEGELGASEMEHTALRENRFSAGMVYEIGARNSWAPYLVGAVGGAKEPDNASSYAAPRSRAFGEVGVGLRWALTDHLHLAFDLRAGAQEDNTETYYDAPTTRAIAQPLPGDVADDTKQQTYTRSRLSALLYF
ncbi:MAG: hypothetical protein R3B48_06730 [Kofleriaceae bacterium]